ncbi:MAG: alpha/beta hydrolase family protein [Armatimonadota bacterium]
MRNKTVTSVLALLILGGLIGGAQYADTASPAKPVRGAYRLYIGQQVVGTEAFTLVLKQDGCTLVSRSRINADDVVVDQTVRVETTPDFRPKLVSASGTIAGNRIFSQITYSDGTAVSTTASGETVTHPAPENSVVLVSNSISVLALLVLRYDRKLGGEQSFVAFPRTAVKVRLRGQDVIRTRRGEEKLDRYEMTTGTQRVTVWCKAQGIPAIVSSQQPGLDAALEPYHTARNEFLLSAVRVVGTQPKLQRPSTYTSQEVRIPARGVRLAGTLTLPDVSSPPCVVLVSSAGPHTRDEEVDGIPVFRQIAEKLASEGYAVLRTDDRGVGASGGSRSAVTLVALVEDVKAAVRYVRARPEVDPAKVVLVGYSEGGVVAAMAASMDPLVAGLVLMGSPCEPWADLWLERALDAVSSNGALPRSERDRLANLCRQAAQRVKSGQKPEGLPEDLVGGLASSEFAPFVGYNPADNLRVVNCPVLILHGGADRQVPPRHARLSERVLRDAGNRKVRVRVLRGLSHQFADEGGAEVSPEAIAVLTEWLADVLGKKGAS